MVQLVQLVTIRAKLVMDLSQGIVKLVIQLLEI